MKIGHLENKAALAPLATERKTATATGTGPEASAKVLLSSSASMLSTAAGETSFDQAKVDRIAQAIRDGRFTVNAEAIADRLIANAEELLGRSTN
jgi:negative regulator of flagellin synthesis FlgM